ncbi:MULTISPECIES: toll/interleukin-1 receptor domain-containing protein [Catenuloplanes]|uniref:WD40 repeat protein n=1 Tax=Catenuloplanes niger TaxID=587534 RepID=A0AAE4CVB0_9ACTN|nr:toll/interleukin-1 receptor domain-containing protein [Catenuloplanes niger]MDR7322634.1 WD40 repeat protein [Catenuloplanes niger]
MRASVDHYDAFISYSHQADKLLAQALQTELEKFARPWYKPRALRVFRDETSLSMTPNAWSTIQAGLEKAEWFVLMASPASAASHWVSQEVQWWLTHRRTDRMLLALTDGDIRWLGRDFDWTMTTALPRALAGRFGEEPLWIDLRQLVPQQPAAPTAPSRITLGDLVAEFAAPIRNRPKDALIGAHLRLGKRIRRLIASTVVVLTLLSAAAVSAAVIANQQRLEAERQARVAKSQQLAANIDALLPTQLDLAQLLAVQAYRIDPNRQTEMALLQAANASPALVRYTHFGASVTALVGSADGRTAVIGTADGEVATWDVASGARRTAGKLSGSVASVAVSGDGAVVAAAGGDGATVWAEGSPPAKLDKPAGEGILAAAVSPSGRFVALSAGPDLGEDGATGVVLSDRTTGRVRKATTTVWPGLLAMPTDSELIASNDSGNWQRLRTADLSGEEPPQVVNAGAHPRGLATSANGNFFGYHSGSGMVQITATTGDVAAREEEGDLFGATAGSEAETMAISPDGRTLATAQAGRIFVTPTVGPGQDQPSPSAHGGNRTISELAFAGDGEHLLSATGTAVVLWDFDQPGRAGVDLPVSVDQGCYSCEAPQVMLSPDGQRVLVAGSRGVISIRELSAAGSEVRLAPDDVGGYRLAGSSPDGSKWYLQAPDGTLEIRSAAALGAPILGRSRGLAPYRVVGLTADEQQAVTYQDQKLELRSVDDGKLIRTLFRQGAVDYHVVVGAGARRLSSSTRRPRASTWPPADARRPAKVRSPRSMPAAITSSFNAGAAFWRSGMPTAPSCSTVSSRARTT